MQNRYFQEYLESQKWEVVRKEYHEYLTYRGLLDSYVYVLKSGVIKTSVILKDGREFNLAYVRPGEIISIINDETSNRTPAPFNIRVESEEAFLYRVNRVEFWRDVNRNLKLQSYVKNYYRENQQAYMYKLQTMLMNGKKGALCAVLCELAELFGVASNEKILIDFPITNEDIAGFCGISSRNSVNRMMRELREADIIEINNRKIVIKDLAYLKSRVAE